MAKVNEAHLLDDADGATAAPKKRTTASKTAQRKKVAAAKASKAAAGKAADRPRTAAGKAKVAVTRASRESAAARDAAPRGRRRGRATSLDGRRVAAADEGARAPAYSAASPSSSSIRRRRLYFAIRSERLIEPVLIWPGVQRDRPGRRWSCPPSRRSDG